jgi:hypothetical protein
MFGDGFELSTIFRTGPHGLTRMIVRSSWAARDGVALPDVARPCDTGRRPAFQLGLKEEKADGDPLRS